MASIPEQFSEARKWQFETQLNLLQALTNQVFESTERVIALNIDASRAAVERSSTAVKQLFTINDPRELLVFGSHGQEQFEQMLAYGRELFSIAAGAQTRLARQAGAAARPAAASPAPASTPAPARQAQAAPEPKPAPAVEAAIAEPASPAAVVAGDEAPAELAAKAKPIAKATGKLAPKAPGAQHPLSSPVVEAAGQVELPMIKPLEASPPPAPVSGTPEIEAKRTERANLKGGRKK